MIERIAIESREQWLALRMSDFTASDGGSLYGEGYRSLYEIYAEKTGLIAPDIEAATTDDLEIVIPPHERGLLLEDRGGELMRRLKPHWMIKKNDEYYRDPQTRMGATPDYLVNDPERGLGVVNIKNPEQWIYERQWKQEDGTIEPPLANAVQVNIEADLAGAAWGAIGAFVVSHRTRFRLIEVPLKPVLMGNIRGRIAKFWSDAEAGIPPAFDYSRDGTVISKLYQNGGGDPIDLSQHNRIAFLCEEKLAWQRRAGNAERALETIEAEITDILKDAEKALHPDFNITRKKQKTGGYSVAPGETRVLRITRKKDSDK